MMQQVTLDLRSEWYSKLAGFPRASQAIDRALPVSAESGKNDIAQLTGLRENKSSTTAR